MSNFRNKRILITGASKGIGFTLAEHLSMNGVRLILHASSDEGIQRLKERFVNEDHLFWKADFTKPEDFEINLEGILDVCGPLDGYVNCVGLRSRRPINLLKVNLVLETMTANFVSYIEVVRLITKRNRFNPGLSILTISSISAHSGSPALSIYAASKAACESANRCLAKELYKKDIRVNTIVCGQIDTEAYQELMQNKESSIDPILERQFMGLGTTADITKIINFMLSSESSFISGQLIPADGGFLV
jgi:NAD(P)-dependent dehydrogenase (short-subunit alcohol dehydrogenase family)